MSIRCLFGVHEPMKYTMIQYRGKLYRTCRRCGKRLDAIADAEIYWGLS